MFAKLAKRVSSVSPRFAIAAVVIAIVGVGGLALLLTRNGSKVGADTELEPRAARIERVEGDVRITRVDENDWGEATLNDPVEVGDRIFARNDAHCSLALTGHNYVRMNPGTSLDVLALADERTQLALRSGSALFDVGALGSDEVYEVATPCGAVDFNEPGLYQIGMDGNNVLVSVLSGLAQVVGEGGSGEIREGDVMTLVGAAAAQALTSRLAPRLGGQIVDDYYRYRYPATYDGRYQDYDSYLSDPFYYDPYRSSPSCRYLPADVPGIYDLDAYGDWANISGYGSCWAPRVGSGWAPFREGSWNMDSLWGPTWVSSEPWGWAPYHYGRWTFVEQRWFWVPSEVVRRPAYCAAPVAFIPLTQTAQIAWVPLAPGEPYVQRYYDGNFQPRYFAASEVIREERARRHFANFDAPSALTVVPVQAFARPIDSRTLVQVDPRVIARNQAVLDPFSVDGVRQIALRKQDRPRRIKLAQEEQDSLNQTVVTSARPVVLPRRGNVTEAFHVEQVPESRKKDRLKIGQIGQVVGSRREDGLPKVPAQADHVVTTNANERDRQMATLADRANRGDKSARRELRQLRRDSEQGGGSNQPNQRTQQEQLHQQMKEQGKIERQQQRAAAAAQLEAARRAQMEQVQTQRKEKQLRRSQQNPPDQQRQPADQQPQGQRKQLKEQSRMQRAQQDAARQSQQQQMRQQQKQQKRLERKPPQASVEPVQRRQELRHEPAQLQRAQQAQASAQAQAAAQQRQQLKAQRPEQQRAMNEQQSRSAAMRASQQAPNAQSREQMKAQRRIERLQSPPPTLPVTQSAPALPQRKAEKAKRKNDGN